MTIPVKVTVTNKPDDPLANLMPSGVACQDTFTECFKSLEKHGPPTANLQRAVNILAEELGEVAQCVNKLTSPNINEQERDKDGLRLGSVSALLYWRSNLREELCQLAAYALLQIQRIDNERMSNSHV